MTKDTVFLKTDDGEQIAVHRWIPASQPAAILQISHGMAEFAVRYDEFAALAASKGFVVYASDHRGHGETAGSLDRLGFLAVQDGFAKVVSDLRAVTEQAIAAFPGIPVVLFAHSFGSFVGQRYIQLWGDTLAACVLSGTKGPDPVMVGLGRALAHLVALVRGKRHRSMLLHNTAFGSYNARIPGSKSANAWLSRDAAEVEKYDASPWCGFVCTAGFFCDLMDGLSLIHRSDSLAALPKKLPVLITGGTDDPVSAYSKTVRKLASIYASRGMSNVDLKLYKGGRHEMMNETNREEFMNDVLSWLQQFVGKA